MCFFLRRLFILYCLFFWLFRRLLTDKTGFLTVPRLGPKYPLFPRTVF